MTATEPTTPGTPAHDRIVLRKPADGSVTGSVSRTSRSEVRTAVRAAERAYREGAWAARAPRDRAAALRALADAMEAEADTLARLDCEDAGKPITECRVNDVPGAIASIRWFAEAVDKRTGTVPVTPVDVLAFTEREPYGVGAAILPWNYPLAMAAWKIGPALATGNSLLVKPADTTPRSVLRVAELATDVGIPADVLRVLTGDGPTTGAALADDPTIGALSFTGSVSTGRRILTAAAASNLKRVSLELGGKSPQLLMDDALEFGDELFAHLIESAFLTSGQNCTAGARVLVHERIHDEVVERLAAAASALRVGDPADPTTELGPVVSDAAADRILHAVGTAVADGAELVAGGFEIPVLPGGRYLAPTVLTHLPAGHAIGREELFGPVVTVHPFRDRAEAIRLANDVPFGLAASVWTTRLDDAVALARGIEAGIVSVGAYSEGDMTVPFGGWKLSGFGGSEKSLRAFEQWTREKAVWIQLRP